MIFFWRLIGRLCDPGAVRARLLLLAALAFGQTILVWCTQEGYGLTWDEVVHVDRSRDAMIWLGDWLGGNISSRAEHADRWRDTWEFLPAPRLLHGLSQATFGGSWLVRGHPFGPIIAFRLLNGLVHGLNCFLIGALVLRLAGLWPAVISLMAYASLPRVFGHAHLAATETVTVTMTMAVTFAFAVGMRRPWAAVLAGVLWGLGLGTKFNLLFAPLFLWPWAFWHHRTRLANAVMAMAFIAPIVWIITWPWVWTNPVEKIVDYLHHFLVHSPVPLLWRGDLWGVPGRSEAPGWYTLDMIAVTTPIPTMGLGVVGWIWCLCTSHREGAWRLMALMGLVPLAVASLPFTPKYDGVRLFLPVFASLAICLGLGASALLTRAFATVPEQRRARLHHTAWGALLVLCSLPGFVGIARLHPSELSYYNLLVGGVAGAEVTGYEISYWGEGVNEEVVAYLNENLPEGALVYPLGMRHGTVSHLTEWGILREDIQVEYPPFHHADTLLIQNRQGALDPRERSLWERALRGGHVWRIPRGSEQGVPGIALLRLSGNDATTPESASGEAHE